MSKDFPVPQGVRVCDRCHRKPRQENQQTLVSPLCKEKEAKSQRGLVICQGHTASMWQGGFDSGVCAVILPTAPPALESTLQTGSDTLPHLPRPFGSFVLGSSLPDPRRRLLVGICQKSHAGDNLVLLSLITVKRGKMLFSPPGSYLSAASGTPHGTRDLTTRSLRVCSQLHLQSWAEADETGKFLHSFAKGLHSSERSAWGIEGASRQRLSGCVPF